MARRPSASTSASLVSSALQPIPLLGHEALYVGVDVGKHRHVASFVSRSLLQRHERFEGCPALSFENSRAGFRSLIERMESYTSLTHCFALLENTGHYHRALVQYLLELDLSVYLMHVQSRPAALLTGVNSRFSSSSFVYVCRRGGQEWGQTGSTRHSNSPGYPVKVQVEGRRYAMTATDSSFAAVGKNRQGMVYSSSA
jgi:Transposase